MSRRTQIIGLVVWLLISAMAAVIGAIASAQAGAFYAGLARPEWAPPGGLFGPVWSVLYLLMGIAAWWVWRVGGFGAARVALTLYLLQLVVNALWSWLFFAWQKGGLAFADVLLLELLVVATLVAFWRIRPLAGALLTPYAMWVAYAAALNYSVWQLNPAVLG
ncbi:tryptophan-rich sensory protein [Xanthomonadaceae bacterium JHOS43]|jgi:benzodiazapine receptor|nr:tryptophan-rich sensory protein [Xanthomonadaceae bacterium JHOS43]